jgi:hypothetical protein
MNFYQNKQLVYINSYYRTNQSDSPSKFSVNIILYATKDYDLCVILKANIPKTNHMINIKNSTFQVIEENSIRDIVIPSGNYSRMGISRYICRFA